MVKMKKVLIALVLAFATTSVFVSCGEQKSETTEQSAETAFYCPMKCEGEKTYAEEGTCPYMRYGSGGPWRVNKEFTGR